MITNGSRSPFLAPSSARNGGMRKVTTADQIKDHILTHNLRPGDSLPTETELCDLLGVSRSNVREAIRTLSTLDIVEVRHGRGTFVGQMSLDALVEALVFRGALTPGDDLRALREVLEVRQALDMAMADKVAASMEGTTNPELHGLVAEMAAASKQGHSFPRQDRAFHTALLSGIDNALVGQLVAAFWDVHTAVMPRLGVSLPADLAKTAHAHGDMLRAAEAGDAAALRASIVDHYEPLARALDGAARSADGADTSGAPATGEWTGAR